MFLGVILKNSEEYLVDVFIGHEPSRGGISLDPKVSS